jgi:hypothetical protein
MSVIACTPSIAARSAPGVLSWVVAAIIAAYWSGLSRPFFSAAL